VKLENNQRIFTINTMLGQVHLMQEKIIGQMNALGFSTKIEATLSALT
jgi:hypothetical protein